MSLQPDPCEIAILSDPSTDLVVNVSSYQRVLKRTRLFALGEVRCPPTHPLFKNGGGPQTCPYIDFMRSSVIRATDGHRPAVLSMNCANFQNVGSIYQRQMLDQRGDFNDWIAVSPAFLARARRQSCILQAERRMGCFLDREIAPITPLQYMAQRHINEMLTKNADLSDLAFDEFLARLVQSVVSSADRYWREQMETKSSPRPVCEEPSNGCRGGRKGASCKRILDQSFPDRPRVQCSLLDKQARPNFSKRDRSKPACLPTARADQSVFAVAQGVALRSQRHSCPIGLCQPQSLQHSISTAIRHYSLGVQARPFIEPGETICRDPG